MIVDLFQLMQVALEEAGKAFQQGEVPVGAVVADPEGRVLARAHNRPIRAKDPTAHAEVLALREAAARTGNYRLEGATLVVTLEPCLMCMGAALQARVARLVYGAADPKAGAAASLYTVGSDPRLNHRIEVRGGVMEAECGELLKEFFRIRRKGADPKQAGEVPKWS